MNNNNFDFQIIENFIKQIKDERINVKKEMKKTLDNDDTEDKKQLYENANNNLKEYHKAIKETIKTQLEFFFDNLSKEDREYFNAYSYKKKMGLNNNNTPIPLHYFISEYIIYKIFLNPRNSITNPNKRNWLFAKGKRTRKDGRKRRRATHFENLSRKLQKQFDWKSISLKTNNSSKNLPTNQTNSSRK
jgi:hypothetical protein